MKSNVYRLPRGRNQIKVWRYCPEKFSGLKPAAIICHGIPGSKPDPHDRGYIPLVEQIVDHGFIAIIFNFAGCGESSGNIDMRVWYEDLAAVHDLVFNLPGIDPKSIHVIGFSAGGAIAARLASQDHLFQSLLLMATPADLATILPDDPVFLRDHFRELGIIHEADFPPDINAWYRGFQELKPFKWMPFISPRPVGIIHGQDDTVVPVEHAYRLYDAALSPKKINLLDGAPHQLRRDPRTAALIIDWLSEVA
jgi:uncharacterized protein